MPIRLLRGALASLAFVVAALFAVSAFADDVMAVPDSGNLVDYRGQDGATGTFRITGATDGTVYGTGIYTDDSDLATAAVHAGLVRPGETRDLTIEILPGRAGYQGSGRNGIRSGDYGQWEGSFKFLDSASAADAAPRGRTLPDPGDLRGYRANVGQTLNFSVTGTTDGVIYGDGVYTDDSTLATAAVHAGLLAPGQRGVIAVVVMPGQQHYVGATRNNIDSRDYGAWDGSYRFAAAPAPAQSPDAIPDPGNLTAYRGRNGQVFKFSVVGNAQGTVYGDGIYTDDSRLAAAAVHAGVLGNGESGIVAVEIMPGEQHYDSAYRNGINSLDYNAWQGSYRFVQQ